MRIWIYTATAFDFMPFVINFITLCLIMHFRTIPFKTGMFWKFDGFFRIYNFYHNYGIVTTLWGILKGRDGNQARTLRSMLNQALYDRIFENNSTWCTFKSFVGFKLTNWCSFDITTFWVCYVCVYFYDHKKIS